MTEPMNTKLSKSQKPGSTRELLEPEHPSKRQTVFNYLIGFAMGLTAVLLAVILYWGLTGKDVLVVHNAPVPVKPAFVKTEEKITVTIDFCKVDKANGTVYTRFVSEKTELVVPTYTDTLAPGCYDNLDFQVPIPPQLTADKWHLNYRIDYKTNPLTTVREEFNTQDFTVTE